MAHTISLRLPDEVFNKLSNLCNEIDRNKSYLIKKAIEQYIDEYSDYQIALDRLRDKDDLILSSEEFRKKIDL